MRESLEIITHLIPLDSLMKNSSEEIIEEIGLNLYKEENNHLFEKELFYKLPTVIKDIILLINFDTELSMQGIFGCLENSTGLFLDETIKSFERIEAEEDAKILKLIRSILKNHNVSTADLRASVNRQEKHAVNNFIDLHGREYEEMADDICKIAESLYLYSEDQNLFDNLKRYVDSNKSHLIEELTK